MDATYKAIMRLVLGGYMAKEAFQHVCNPEL
jgi:hypothetical protein